MADVQIREKQLSLEGWVFVFVGAQTFFGKLHTIGGLSYLEPAYIYRCGDEYKINEKGERVDVRVTRELRPPLGFPEVRRLDLDSKTGVGIEELRPASRAVMVSLVRSYEENLQAQSISRLAIT